MPKQRVSTRLTLPVGEYRPAADRKQTRRWRLRLERPYPPAQRLAWRSSRKSLRKYARYGVPSPTARHSADCAPASSSPVRSAASTHLVFGRGGERRDAGKTGGESADNTKITVATWVVLQHDLRQPHRVRIAAALPRRIVAACTALPGGQAGGEAERMFFVRIG